MARAVLRDSQAAWLITQNSHKHTRGRITLLKVMMTTFGPNELENRRESRLPSKNAEKAKRKIKKIFAYTTGHLALWVHLANMCVCVYLTLLTHQKKGTCICIYIKAEQKKKTGHKV